MPGNNVNPLTGGFHQQGPSGGLSNAPQRIPRGFMCIDQVREVEDLVRTTLLRHIEQPWTRGRRPTRSLPTARASRSRSPVLAA